ncbi:MAG: DUF1523 family protein, partial [Pseudomonadota bacterium]
DIGSSAIFWANPDANTSVGDTRDVRFVNAIWPNGKPRVYRNEDTHWGWPPYFKFDSGNINAEAQNLAKRDDQWVAVTHYGWRIEWFTIFPNIIHIRTVEGPDVTLIPWFNIVFFVILAIILFMIWRAISAFKRKRIDPMIEDIDEMMDDVSESATQARDRAVEAKRGFLTWLKDLFRKKA